MTVTFDKDLPMLGQRFPFGKHLYEAVEQAGCAGCAGSFHADASDPLCCELPDCVVDQVIWVRVEP